MSNDKKLMVSLDRIEEGIAVLLSREGHIWLLPVEYLPEDCGEGDVLDVILRRNQEETGQLSGRIHDLQQQLLDRTRDRNETSG